MSGWHEEYRERYRRLKEKGAPFFPNVVVKDALGVCLVAAALAALAWLAPPQLEAPADPTDSNYNPRPEWYFLFLFQALKLFPGSLEALAAVGLPAAALALLAAVPFLDRGPERHPLDRPWWTALGAAALSAIALLSWAGWRSPLANPAEARSPLEARGLRLFGDLKCAYCHRVGETGGTVGPRLDRAATARPADWTRRHLRDPQAVSPGSPMPRLSLLDEEIDALAAYVGSLRAEEPFTPEAPKLFAEHCASCHRLGPEGGDSAPDLSLIGTLRDKAYLRRYIADPARVNRDAAMPGYQEQLTDVQIEDLARFLAAQGRN